MISNFQDIPTFISLKSHLLSLIRPKIKSTFGIHDALGLRYLFQLKLNLNPLRSHKRRHNFSDTPETCECNLGIEDIRHFLFECPFYAIQRMTLAVNVIDTLQRKNLSHLRNQPELIIDKFYYHAIFNFSYVGLTPLLIPHTPSSFVTIVFDLFYLLLYSVFFTRAQAQAQASAYSVYLRREDAITLINLR